MGKSLTFQSFNQKFNSKNEIHGVFSYYDYIITDLIAKNKIGNAANYKQSKIALRKFVGEKEMMFSDIDISFLNRWETKLSKTCSGNSISNYMRTLRALYNRAIDEGYCNSELYPFKNPFNRSGFNIKKLETETAKRALTEEVMNKIINCQLPDHSTLFDSKNIFLFSYYMMGMNFVDIAKLKWSDIQNGRVNYRREKTGKQYSIKVLPPVQTILDYYFSFSGGKGYVFPVFSESLKSEQEKYTKRRSALKRVNNEIKEIAKIAGVENYESITTYVIRHSWGTILKRKGISTSLISDGYGHESEETTQIYLDEFENTELDEMNEKLLDRS